MSTILTIGQELIEERIRQTEEEGFSAARDDKYKNKELARAAAAFALSGHDAKKAKGIWPTTWIIGWFKYPNYRRALVKAGALIIAEIGRIDRNEQKELGE